MKCLTTMTAKAAAPPSGPPPMTAFGIPLTAYLRGPAFRYVPMRSPHRRMWQPMSPSFPSRTSSLGRTCKLDGDQGIRVSPKRCSGKFRAKSFAAFGEVYHLLGQPQPAKADDFAFATKFWELVEDLLRQDRFRLGPLVHRREGGLAGIPNGLSELKAGHVAAGKLVFTVEV